MSWRLNPSFMCSPRRRSISARSSARTITNDAGAWDLHQFRHSAATHLGDKKVSLQLIMAKTRHKSPRTAMRYIKPGGEAVAEVTELLDPPRRRH